MIYARSLIAFTAEVLFGLKPSPRCPVCDWHARGDRSLAAHIGRHVVRVKP